jgi:hypothetical protein
MARLKRDPLNVFINAPFDAVYDPMLEAMVFMVHAAGYRARCALEANDSGDIRLDKLARLIDESPRSIHDLSRIKPVNPAGSDLPRFNMPFDLGMTMGAKRFSRSHHNDKIKIMVAKPYKLPQYLSDLGGNDPDAHHDEPHQVLVIVRDFLQGDPSRRPVTWPHRACRGLRQVQEQAPANCGEHQARCG